MPAAAYTATVPRQEFTGWLLSVAAFSQAGLSAVDFLFHDGGLRLLSYWGETRMPYDGNFTGKLTIKPQRLLTLAKKGAKMMPQPIPIKLTVDVDRKVLVVDLVEVHAEIEVHPTESKNAPAPVGRPNCVGLTMAAGLLLDLVRQAYPGRPGKKEHIKFIASSGALIAQSSRGSARHETFIVGAGQWVVSAQVILKVLSSFGPKEILTLEGDAKSLRFNSFTMPVLSWQSLEG